MVCSNEKRKYKYTFYTSFLFLIPAIIAYYVIPKKDVAIASFACFVTSVIAHYYNCENHLASIIDIVIVRAIGIFYLIHSIVSIGVNPIIVWMYACSVISVGLYLQIRDVPKESCKWHYLIHISSVAGILIYILARHTYLSY
jgi:hypothetical protein